MGRKSNQFGGPLPGPVLRTAHDVRHLVICEGCANLGEGCANLGDDRHMVRAEKGKLWHGRCVISKHGFSRLLTYPKMELERLTIGDLGPRYMGRLLNSWEAL